MEDILSQFFYGELNPYGTLKDCTPLVGGNHIEIAPLDAFQEGFRLGAILMLQILTE